jgi:hypothetical protein
MQAEIQADATWRKSSYSGGGSSGGDCVEMAGLTSGAAVRDSKNTPGPVLAFGHAPWHAFLTGLRAEPRG